MHAPGALSVDIVGDLGCSNHRGRAGTWAHSVVNGFWERRWGEGREREREHRITTGLQHPRTLRRREMPRTCFTFFSFLPHSMAPLTLFRPVSWLEAPPPWRFGCRLVGSFSVHLLAIFLLIDYRLPLFLSEEKGRKEEAKGGVGGGSKFGGTTLANGRVSWVVVCSAVLACGLSLDWAPSSELPGLSATPRPWLPLFADAGVANSSNSAAERRAHSRSLCRSFPSERLAWLRCCRTCIGCCRVFFPTV